MPTVLSEESHLFLFCSSGLTVELLASRHKAAKKWKVPKHEFFNNFISFCAPVLDESFDLPFNGTVHSLGFSIRHRRVGEDGTPYCSITSHRSS